ncbi:MAG TPA: DUF6176 family protein [bacterium]|nr:DUF6176 family protein [bacterium]
MSEARLIKFQFKPDGARKWLNWSDELKRRREEVFETLRNEGVIAEACFLSPAEDAVYYFVAAEDLGRAEDAWRRSHHVIDREHERAKSSALEHVAQLRCLFFFDNR